MNFFIYSMKAQCFLLIILGTDFKVDCGIAIDFSSKTVTAKGLGVIWPNVHLSQSNPCKFMQNHCGKMSMQYQHIIPDDDMGEECSIPIYTQNVTDHIMMHCQNVMISFRNTVHCFLPFQVKLILFSTKYPLDLLLQYEFQLAVSPSTIELQLSVKFRECYSKELQLRPPANAQHHACLFQKKDVEIRICVDSGT